jgi:hypothetical protein
MVFFTTFWTYWSAGEMYHEGWWGAWYNRLPYLAPIAVTLIPTLITFRWPIAGGGLIMAIGAFALFFFAGDVAYIGLAIALVGLVFLMDGLTNRRGASEKTSLSSSWWRRYWRYALAVGLPQIVFAGVSVYLLPVVLTRVDDGDRSARLIEGNGVTLVWAPEGPGWNWQQSWGLSFVAKLCRVRSLAVGWVKTRVWRHGAGYATHLATAADLAQTTSAVI